MSIDLSLVVKQLSQDLDAANRAKNAMDERDAARARVDMLEGLLRERPDEWEDSQRYKSEWSAKVDAALATDKAETPTNHREVCGNCHHELCLCHCDTDAPPTDAALASLSRKELEEHARILEHEIIQTHRHAAEAERARDAANAKATQYESDWRAAKIEFGDAMTRVRLERDSERQDRIDLEKDFALERAARDAAEKERDSNFLSFQQAASRIRALAQAIRDNTQGPNKVGISLEEYVDRLFSERDQLRAENAQLRGELEGECKTVWLREFPSIKPNKTGWDRFTDEEYATEAEALAACQPHHRTVMVTTVRRVIQPAIADVRMGDDK